MAAQTIQKLTNANCYLNGISRLGVVKEMNIPQVKAIPLEHTALGTIQKTDFAGGFFEKMEAEITWNGPTLIDLSFASNVFNQNIIQFRGNVQQQTVTGKVDIPFIINLTGWFDGTPGVNQQAMQETDFKSTLHVQVYQLIFNGVEIIYLNSFTNEYRIDGVDVMAAYRNNIGA